MHSEPSSADKDKQMRVTVIVASLGRPDVLADLLVDLAGQTRQPDQIILSVTSQQDLPSNLVQDDHVSVIIGSKGSCVQRNRALDALDELTDLVVFCDDDYVPAPTMIDRAVAFFGVHGDVVGASGRLIADGIHGAGYSVAEARALLTEAEKQPPQPLAIRRNRQGLYGCNMVFRRTAIADVRFDENLPLYGWQEDIDFSAQAARHGRIVGTWAFSGVHRGVKHGRTSGLRMGYSQVVNPAFLVRKGTMPWRFGLRIAARNVAANHLRMLRPEPWVDRWGRVRGNWLGLLDLLRGRITPERILRLN